ncbi:MAG: 50S ribosomal protein L4 [Candidatus Aenigmarchaeota archaeon]|nr:50S ribosomal protein L4 [Candidatus Aenigmarchaeota archaeon]
MKANIVDVNAKQKAEITLPKVFNTAYRPDLIKRAVLAIQSHNRQAFGTDPLAGHRTSAHYHGVRKGPHHMMNTETARMKRIHGGPPNLSMRARFVSQSVKGRAAHPPQVEKVWDQKINKKEKVLAIKSAIAATIVKDIVVQRGHVINGISLPLIVEDNVQDFKKTQQVKAFLEKLGLKDELERASVKKVRAGKGKARGRKYKKRKSILFVVSDDKGISKAVKNIPGSDFAIVKNLNAELLAPGTHAGRLVVWSESAIRALGEIYG